jgi:class 3 adenylate cyclase
LKTAIWGWRHLRRDQSAGGKQFLSFWLDCLVSIIELNRELDKNLQISVGVQTGGPIAGLLGGIGWGKLTFETLGRSINIEQRMEHHNAQMKVHISRVVYELIHGVESKVAEWNSENSTERRHHLSGHHGVSRCGSLSDKYWRTIFVDQWHSF